MQHGTSAVVGRIGQTMLKACALAVFAAVVSGCAAPVKTWKGALEWPNPEETPLVAPSMEAGAALAAAAAIREMVRQNTSPRLFRGCSSPEQGLDVAVFKDPKSGLYYVVLEPRFDRCGGPRVRVLDWWYEYAVTAQGEVVAEAPPMAGGAPVPRPRPSPSPPEQIPPPAAPRPDTEGKTPEPAPPPVPAPQPTPEAQRAPPTTCAEPCQ
jgi:hypothetical protein